MKKIILSVCSLAISLSSIAQVSKGVLAVGGSLGLRIQGSSNTITVNNSATTNTGPTTTSIEILPAAQFFLMDKLSIGAQVGYSNTSTLSKGSTTTSAGGVNTESLSIRGGLLLAPFARYYYMLDEKFGVFGQLAIPIQIGNFRTENRVGNTTTTQDNPFFGIGASVSPGIVFFPIKKIGLEATLGNVIGFNSYTSSSTRDSAGTKVTSVSNSTSFDFMDLNSFNLRFGVMYYFAQ